MKKYYTCDPEVVERGTHGCYFCDKSLYTYLKNNVGKYTLLGINTKGTFSGVAKIPSNLCIKIFLENKMEYSEDIVTIRKVRGRDFVFDKKTKKLLGYKLYYNPERKLYIVDDGVVDAIEEYKNIVLLQKIFGGEYEKYVLHPRENALMYLITSHDSPVLFETDENKMELSRVCLPILVSRSCNNRIILTDKNVNKYISDIIGALRIIHSKGYIHGDMKLINSVKCSGGFKLIDWGTLSRANTNQILMTTFIMPFLAVWILYQYGFIKTMGSISSWQQLENLERIYNDKIVKSHFISDHGWRLATLSYNMFYKFYVGRDIDLSYINKKNDEYATALDVYQCLINYIDPDDLYNRLLHIHRLPNDKYKKAVLNLYYLLSPEYLSLKKI